MNKSVNPYKNQEDAAPLLKELALMAEKLRPGLPDAEGASSAPADDNSIAIFRLVPGVDLGQWQEWAASGHCEGWVALDIPVQVRSELRQWLAQRGVAGLPPALPMPAASTEIPLETRQGISANNTDDTDTANNLLTALPSPSYLLERLRHEAGKARARRGAMSLALFEVSAPEPFGESAMATTKSGGEQGKNGFHKALAVLTETLWRNCRHEDTSGSLQSGILGLIMPGVGSFPALALAERIVNDTCRVLGLPHDGSEGDASHAASCATACRLRAGVSEIPGEGGAEQEAAAVLEQAREALQMAAPGSGAAVRERVRLYRKNTAPAERETLVLASEKQFLFFGGMQ